MENNNQELKLSGKNSELLKAQENNFKLVDMVTKAMELTGFDGDEQQVMITTKDICTIVTKVFLSDLPGIPKIDMKGISQAMMLGSTGKYGKTYKLTGQEVCSWIWKYLDEVGGKPTFNIEP